MALYPVRNADGVIVATWDDDALLLTRFDIDPETGEPVIRPGYPKPYTEEEAAAAAVRLGYRLAPAGSAMALSQLASAIDNLETVLAGAAALGAKAPADVVPADVVALGRGLAVVTRQVLRLTRFACRAVSTTDPEADASG